MEANRLKTSDDLEAAWLDGDRFELINGEIVKRARSWLHLGWGIVILTQVLVGTVFRR